MNAKTSPLPRGRWFAAPTRPGLALVLGVLLTGCPASKHDKPPITSGDKVVIRGSNTFGEELAPRLIAAFKKEHANTDFDLESKATVYGSAALLGGKADIAAASRPPLKEELELARMRGIEMNSHTVGSYSVAVIVHGNNPVGSLTKEQVRDIFAGGVKNWKAVGGPDAPISCYIRDPIAGTHLGFKELALGNQAYSAEAKLFTDYETIVKSVIADPNGIGYSSLDLAKNPGVKAVSVSGVEPSVTTVHQGNYPYSRVVKLYTAKGRESDHTKAFIQFIQSASGKEIVTLTGFTP